jgi:hypothetical protein
MFGKLATAAVTCMLFTATLFAAEPKLNKREKALVEHVKESIARAEQGDSALTTPILQLRGMSSAKVRHLLNNLCSRPDTHYLEIGVWAGSTFVSALYENQLTASGIAIDNWSGFGGPEAEFRQNCKRHLHPDSYQVYSVDSFAIDPTKLIPDPITVYFYDGNHSRDGQKKAFTYYNSVLDDLFVAIVDDWNRVSTVQAGTRDAFAELGYTVLYEAELPGLVPNDRAQWWNGLYVAVVRK